jgi:hypothetical protein
MATGRRGSTEGTTPGVAGFPMDPPIEPMLAKIADGLLPAEGEDLGNVGDRVFYQHPRERAFVAAICRPGSSTRWSRPAASRA